MGSGYLCGGLPDYAKSVSVYDWLQSFSLGETRKIPSNCDASDLISYAHRHPDIGYAMRVVGDSITRVCPHCGR